jgi:hypothetical protein
MKFYSALTAVSASILTLTLAGCRNPPPSTALKSDSPALRGIQSWVARGAGQYDGRFIGSLNYDNQIMAIFGHLDLINAYRFTIALQSTNGQCAFILRRNWAGLHFSVPPSDSYLALARVIGEGVSLAFRRPEGPWRANVKGSADVVRYKDANDNRFQWRLLPGANQLLPAKLAVKTPSGTHYMMTYTNDGAQVPDALTIVGASPAYVLQLRLAAHNIAAALAQSP